MTQRYPLARSILFELLIAGVCSVGTIGMPARLLAGDAAPASEIVVRIDPSKQVLTSRFEIGVTHTHAMWESGHPDAVARVKKQLEEARIRYQNQHLMGWGANNPQPSPGVYSWSSLDRRLDLIRSMAHTVPVITFCTAPGWMKTSGKDWNMEERVADEHVEDFANLCRAVALHYPHVEYFQIWNEFKGYWIKGGRDVERFTVLYNAVYDAVKAARPEVKIGGPYLSMGGRNLSPNDRQVMDYWRQHSRGADFFTFDGWLEGWPPGGKTEDWMMGRTRFFGDLVKEFQTMIERPVWISEFYGGRSKNPQFTAANHASCYYHALQSGACLALLWDGVGLGQLFTRTQTADGGQPTPHCLVVQAFNQHFGPGTQLYQTESSSDDIEVLASRVKILLINKRPGAVGVRLEGKELTLAGYEVRVLGTGQSAKASGPLRVHPTNPRYFTDGTRSADGSLKAIYLTGSHTWNNLVDMDQADPPASFDFEAYLDFLQRYGHNFIRLWTWDSVTWDTRANGRLGKDFVHHVAPLPWARTGPGTRVEGVPPSNRGQDARDTALDGKPKFDLTRFNPAYFDRLRTRVRAAGERGIYVSVMLFEGWGLSHADHRVKTADAWAYRSHPFHPDNNINGITGDLNGDGNALEVHALASPAITALQAAYIRKVVDTVNDLDSVLYEVINEGGNKEWNWWVVQTVKDYERTKPRQHPVGITGHGGERLATMIVSPADWISPGSQDGYRDPPPAWEGRKVSLLDTDHIWGVGGNAAWAWKSFLRGHNPIFMDPYDGSLLGERRGEGVPPLRREAILASLGQAPTLTFSETQGQDARATEDKAKMASPQFEPLRRALGHTRRYADRMNLAAMMPHSELASTAFCLADPGKEYLVYLPEGGEAKVDLSAAIGPLRVEWMHPVEGTTQRGDEVAGGAERTFQAPFNGDAVLYLRAGSH